MVPEEFDDQAGPMTTSPPETPAEPHAGEDPRDRGGSPRPLAALRRSRSDKKIAGVAGGISQHLDIDPIITRVVLVVLVFFGGAGLVVYGACWLLVPVEGQPRATIPLDDRSRTLALLLTGLVATLLLLSDSLGSWEFPWPVLVASFVVVAVMLHRGRDARDADDSRQAPLDHPQQYSPYDPPQKPQQGAIAYPPPSARTRRSGPVLFWYALALIAVAVGILASIDLAGLDVAASAYPAIALVTSGVMLVLGAFWGRPGGLIALGVVASVATAGALAAGDLDIDQVEQRPVASSTLLDSYDLDIGEIVLDLTDIRDLEALDGTDIDLDVGLGRIEVIVPERVSVAVTSDLGAGDSFVFGATGDSGRTTYAVDAGPDAPSLSLAVHVGLGDIDIHREGESS